MKNPVKPIPQVVAVAEQVGHWALITEDARQKMLRIFFDAMGPYAWLWRFRL